MQAIRFTQRAGRQPHSNEPPPPLFAVLGRFWPLVAEMRVAKTGRLLLVLHGGPAVNDYGDWFATQGHGKVVN